MTPEANLNCSVKHPPLAQGIQARAASREARERKCVHALRAGVSRLIAFGVPLATLVATGYVVVVAPTPEIKQLVHHNFAALAEGALGKKDSRADSAEEEIRHNYEKMVEAQQAQDAEGLVHFISPTTNMVAVRDNEPWRHVLRRAFENGEAVGYDNGISPLVLESARALRFERGPVDAQNNFTRMQVSYQVEEEAAFTNYRDTWVKEGGTWKFQTYEKRSEFIKADAEKAIRAAYARMDRASSATAAATFASFLSHTYSYITKTGVTIFAPEVQESIAQFVKRHRWSQRRARLEAGRFEGDGKYLAARRVLVPLKNHKEATALYQDTWERQGETWRLVQTTVQEQNTQLNARERERPRLIDAIRRTNAADIEACRTLDPAPLYNAYIGKALESELAVIQDLQSKQIYRVSEIREQRFERFALSAETARVHVVEVWTSQAVSSATGQAGQPVTSSIPQTYHLVKRGGEWVVEDVIFDRR